MSLDYAWQVFFAAVQDAVTSEQPLRKRAEQLCAASLDKLRGDEPLREDLAERITRVREARTRLREISESEVRNLLTEVVAIYDAISAQLYSIGRTKTIGNH
jgi:transposase